MKKLAILAIIGVALIGTQGWSAKEGDTDDTSMPIYYYENLTDTDVKILDNSWAARTQYRYEKVRGFDPIVIPKFENLVDIDIRIPLLEVELSDTVLKWFIKDYPADDLYGPDERGRLFLRCLAGNRKDNNTGITLRVLSTNREGAEISFAGAADVELISPGKPDPKPTLTTYYALSTQTTAVIPNPPGNDPEADNLDVLIPASSLNNIEYKVPQNIPDENGVKYRIWSAIDVHEEVPEKSLWYDDFSITIVNLQ